MSEQEKSASDESEAPDEEDTTLPRVDVTVYAGADKPDPIARDSLTWEEFCAEIEAGCTDPSEVHDKKDLRAIGPYRLRANTKRAAENVEEMSGMVALDLDGVDIAALRSALAGVDAIVHGSPSDNPEGTRKVRVYVRADRPHDPSDAGSVRDAVASALGVTHDASTRNADRIFFYKRLANTPPRYVERFRGAPISIDALPPAPTSTPREREQNPERPPDREAAIDAVKYALIGALGPAKLWDGHKHALCGALGGIIRKATAASGFREADCAELVRHWLATSPNTRDIEAGVRWACGAWAKPVEEVSGRQALDAIVGSVRGAIVEQALLLPWRSRIDAPAIEVPAASITCVGDFDHPTVWEGEDPEIEYVCEGLRIAPSDGKITTIFGQPGAGKGPLADYVGICLSLGLPILGRAVVRGRVMITDFEGVRLTNRRVRRFVRGLGRDPRELTGWLYAHDQRHVANPLDPCYFESLKRYLGEREIRVLIVDSYTSATLSAGLDPTRPEYALLAKMLGSLDIVVIVVAHANKASAGTAEPRLSELAHSGAFASLVGTAIAVSKPDADDPYLIRVSCARAPDTSFAPFCARFSDDEQGLHLAEIEAAKAKQAPAKRGSSANAARSADYEAKVRKAGLAIMHQIDRNIAMRKLEAEHLGGGQRNARQDAMMRLIEGALIETRGYGMVGITQTGRDASDLRIAEVLGVVGEFQRG